MNLLMVSVHVSSLEISMAKWKQERQIMHRSVKEIPEFFWKVVGTLLLHFINF